MNTPPPSLPANHPATSSPSKPFYLTSIIIAAVGILPSLVYLLVCFGHMETAYRTGGNVLLVMLMALVGLLLHGIGLICGVVAIAKKGRAPAVIGTIANTLILLGVLFFGFISIAMA